MQEIQRQKVQANAVKSVPKTSSVPSSSATASVEKNQSKRVLHNSNSVDNTQRHLDPLAFDPTVKKLTNWIPNDWERVRHTDWSRCQQAQRWIFSVNVPDWTKALRYAFVFYRPVTGRLIIGCPCSKFKADLLLGWLKFGCKFSSKWLSFGCHSTVCSKNVICIDI